MNIYDVELDRVTTRYGRFYVVRNDSVIGRSLKLYGEWAEDEINSYAALLSNGETVLDVGANIGTHAVALASRLPHSEVVAFEPQPLAFALLVANALAARTANVYPRGLGCAEAEGVIHVVPDYSAMDWNVGGFSLQAGVKDAESGALPVAMVALDDLKFQKRVQFIKIDVEGMEESVLAGATKLIERDRPIIYFEVLGIERLKGARDLLTGLGYELRWLKSEAFNPRNYRLNPENIWGRGETGVLAMPSRGDSRVAHLSEVTGEEAQVPVIEYPGA
jgi:FkbM family methyltransferase